MTTAVADTHALIWWTLGPGKKLGRRANHLFSEAERGRCTIYVPAMALVEVAEALQTGRLRAASGFGRWMGQLLASAFVVADLTPDIVLEAEGLYAIPERSDRLIAATATHLDCPLISRDPVFARVAGLETIW